jgi:hypothetical protein
MSLAILLLAVFGVIGGMGGGVTNDGAARSLVRADFAASICAFKLGFAINSLPLLITVYTSLPYQAGIIQDRVKHF